MDIPIPLNTCNQCRIYFRTIPHISLMLKVKGISYHTMFTIDHHEYPCSLLGEVSYVEGDLENPYQSKPFCLIIPLICFTL